MKSLGIFVGGSKCNENCGYCAGKVHKKEEPDPGEVLNHEKLKAILEGNKDTLQSISLTSAGEPTLYPESVSNTLELIQGTGVKPARINLYTNGYGQNTEKMASNLFDWRNRGLTSVYLSLNPALRQMSVESLLGLSWSLAMRNFFVRFNLVLHKDTFPDYSVLTGLLDKMKRYKFPEKFEGITAWFPRDKDDKYDMESACPIPDIGNLEKEYPFLEIYDLKEDRYKDGEKMTLYPNGVLSDKWCS